MSILWFTCSVWLMCIVAWTILIVQLVRYGMWRKFFQELTCAVTNSDNPCSTALDISKKSAVEHGITHNKPLRCLNSYEINGGDIFCQLDFYPCVGNECVVRKFTAS